VRQVFLQHHADLLSPAFWLKYQQRIQDGQVIDIYPYERSRRFSRLRAAA
jgi:isocitrate dehydrogenase kinase/phosphatase